MSSSSTYTLLEVESGSDDTATTTSSTYRPSKPPLPRPSPTPARLLLLLLAAAAAALALFSPSLRRALARPQAVLAVRAQPEGIAPGPGNILYVGRVNTGGVSALDVSTGNVSLVVPDAAAGAERRGATGLVYDGGYLLVCGGGPGWGGAVKVPRLHVFDAASGRGVVSCDVEPVSGGFANDVAVFRGVAYVTNSFGDTLRGFSVAALRGGRCESVGEVRLGYEWDALSPRRPNGVFGSEEFGGVFVGDFGMGSVWFVDVDGGEGAVYDVVRDYGAQSVDGVVVVGRRLYAVQKAENVVTMWDLRRIEGRVRAEKVGNHTLAEFNKPSSGAVKSGRMFVANNGAVKAKEGEEKSSVNTFLVTSFVV